MERNLYLRWGRRRSRLRRRVRGHSKCEQSSRLEIVQASHFVLLLCWCDWKRGISGSWPAPSVGGKLLVENMRNCSRCRPKQSVEGKRFQTYFFECRHPCGAPIKIVPSVRLYANEVRAAGRVFLRCDRPTRHFSGICRRISNCVTKGLQCRVLHKKTHNFPRVCRTKKFTEQKWRRSINYTLFHSSVLFVQVLRVLR
jgi:hypothetical protein